MSPSEPFPDSEPQSGSPARPANTTKSRTANNWRSIVVQTLAVVFTLSITGGMVAYSAMLTFEKPRLTRTRGFEEDPELQAFLAGRVEANEHGLRVPMGDVVVLVFSTNAPPAYRNVRDIYSLIGGSISGDLGCTQTDIDGEYRLTRAAYPSFQPGEYFVLTTSLSRLSTGAPSAKDLQQLERQFEDPTGLLGNRQYHLARVTLTDEATRAHDIFFEEPAARTPLKIEE